MAALNAAFAHLQLPARCLPLGVGNIRLFGKVIEAVKLAGAVIDAEHRHAILQIATEREPSTARTGAADLILHRDNKWHAADTRMPATANALEAAMRIRSGTDHPLAGRIVLLAGVNDLTRMMARELKQRGSVLILAGHDRDAAHQLAQEMKCRFVPFEALYTTIHDALVVCDETAIHPGYLKPSMTVLDLTAPLGRGGVTSPLLREAEAARLHRGRAATVVVGAGVVASASVDQQRGAAPTACRSRAVVDGRGVSLAGFDRGVSCSCHPCKQPRSAIAVSHYFARRRRRSCNGSPPWPGCLPLCHFADPRWQPSNP